MLAIKECLIREGVLNLVDSSYNNNKNNNKNHKINIDFQQNTESIDSNKNNCNNNHNINNNNNSIQIQIQKQNQQYQQYQQPLHRHHHQYIVANMDNEASAQSKYQKSVESKNLVSNTENIQNLNSALATAKASCQQIQIKQQGQFQNQSLQQQQQQQQKRVQEEEQEQTEQTQLLPKEHIQEKSLTTATPIQATQRYKGHHPHFHHHTAPAYYTDLHLRIHTPNAADVAALNDNYQSVYSTASKLVEQRHFPKTATATVAPPPIRKAIANTTPKASSLSPAFNNNQQQTRSAFFRGGSAYNNEHQITIDKYAKESPTFAATAAAAANNKKGDYIATTDSPHTIESSFLANQPENNCNIGLEIGSGVNFTCTNFKPTNQYLEATTIAVASPSTGRRSRSTSHFANRKRAVRVRSESRPISALYDIICKEKGFDIATTTTNDEDSSASLSSTTTTTTPSHDEHRQLIDTINNNNKHSNKKKHPKRHSNKKQTTSYSATSSISKSKSFSSNMSSLSNSSCLKQSRSGKVSPTSAPTPTTTTTTKAKISSRSNISTMQDRPELTQPLPLQSKRRLQKQNVKTATRTTTPTILQTNEYSTTYDYPADRNSLNLLKSSSQSSNKVAKSSTPTSTNASKLQNHEQQQQQHEPSPQHQHHYHHQSPHEHQQANLNHHNLQKQNEKSEVFNLEQNTCNHHPQKQSHHSSAISPLPSSSSPPSLIAKVDDLYDLCHNVTDIQPKMYLKPSSLPAQNEQSTMPLTAVGNITNTGATTTTTTIINQTTVAPLDNTAIIASSTSTHSASAERGIRTGLSRQLRDEKRRQTENAIVNIVKPLYDNDATTSSANNDNCWHGNDDDYSKGTSANARRFITRQCQRDPLRGHRTNYALTNQQQQQQQHLSDSSTSSSPSPTLNYFSPSPVSSLQTIVPSAADSTVSLTASSAAAAAAADISPITATTNGNSNCSYTTSNATTSSTVMTNSAGAPAAVLVPANNSYITAAATVSSSHSNSSSSDTVNNGVSASDQVAINAMASADNHIAESHIITNHVGSTNRPITMEAMRKSDKKRDDEDHHHYYNRGHRSSLPTSPIAKSYGLKESKASTSLTTIKLQRSSFSPSLDTKNKSQYHQYCSSETEQRNSHPSSPIQSRKRSIELHETPKKLKPQLSVSKVEQTLSETQFNTIGFSVVDAAGDGNYNISEAIPRLELEQQHQPEHQQQEQQHNQHQQLSKLQSAKKPFRKHRAETVELTMRVAPLNATKTKSPTMTSASTAVVLPNAHRLKTSEQQNQHPQEQKHTHRPRSSTMTSEAAKTRTSKSAINGGTPTKEEKPTTTGTGTPTTLQSPELSPVQMTTLSTSPTTTTTMEQRDKSSKRKSNLNRSLNEEATINSDESSATRRRRRRELGLARPLMPTNDATVRDIIVAPARVRSTVNRVAGAADPTMHRNDIGFHMENARRGLDMAPTTSIAAANAAAERKRAQTASPKVLQKQDFKLTASGPVGPVAATATAMATNASRLSRRSETLPLSGEMRKIRTKDVNRKINEHTKHQLEEIMNIVGKVAVKKKQEQKEQASIATMAAIAAIEYDVNTVFEAAMAPPTAMPALSPAEEMQQQFQPEHVVTLDQEQIRKAVQPAQPHTNSNSAIELKDSVEILRQRVLKACSVERDVLPIEPPKVLSPILRRKSTDDPLVVFPASTLSTTCMIGASPTAQNQIVSILKKKDYLTGESSSTSSNASPVTFSASVIDTPIKQKRAGILKKRSSLDESRYYSRSHSPDERSILIKTTRRNSFEEIAASSLTPQQLQQQQQNQPQQQQQQTAGILKQSSYDSNKSDGCPSATEMHPHSILKKKDSTSTPSDLAIGIGAASGGSIGIGGHKHVSISQAVTLAAAELVRESNVDYGNIDDCCFTPSNEDYEIRPILKQESTSSEDIVRPPKPILKKKSSGDSDDHGIRPILKTSRKSSREEFYDASSDEMNSVRPILKTESPSKRRSLGGIVDGYLLSPPNSPIATTSSSLLKRRTRSLERHDGSHIVDLAAALDAIATSQATAAAPTDSAAIATTTSTTATTDKAPIEPPSNLSLQHAPTVAERIRTMEMFLNRQSLTPPLANSTLATTTPNNNSLDAAESIAGSTIYKPSILRRDLYRERYKTQPVTSDEKNFYKENSSPFEASGGITSVFRPTASQNTTGSYVSFAQLQKQQQQQQQQQQLQQSTSSANIVTLRHCFNQNNIIIGNNNKAFAIARSNTQPIYCYKQQQQRGNSCSSNSSSGITSPPPLPPTSTISSKQQAVTNNKILQQQQQLSNIHLHNDSSINSNITNFNDQSTLSIGSDSERIFEMSGIEQRQQQQHSLDSPMQPISEHNDLDGGDNALETPTTPSGVTVGRNNSVRARANMFQQLQQQRSAAAAAAAPGTAPNTTRDNEQKRKLSPKRITRRISPPPAHYNNSNMHDEPRTPNNSIPDEEIEPSSLPLSERLRFFSNLSAHNNMSSNSFILRSPTSSISLLTERCSLNNSSSYSYYTNTTPRSCRTSMTTTSSSASITPTPMEYATSPITINHISHSGTTQKVVQSLCNGQVGGDIDDDTQIAPTKPIGFVQLRKSVSQSLMVPAQQQQQQQLDTALTPTAKRIKLKTIGKLMLPSTFLANDRNNNKLLDIDATTPTAPAAMTPSTPNQDQQSPVVKKIGKIKSPFIENCNQLQQQQQQQQPLRQPFSYKHIKYDNKLQSTSPQLETEMNGGVGGMVNGVRKCHSNNSLHTTITQLKLNNGNTNTNIIHSNTSSNNCCLVNGDAGKENCEHATATTTASTGISISDVRKRFVRSISSISRDPQLITQNTTTMSPQSQPTTTTTTAARNAYNISQSADIQRSRSATRVGVDTKFAKYFGIDTIATATTKPTSTICHRASTGALYSNVKLLQDQTTSPHISNNVKVANSLRHIDELMRSMNATTTKFAATINRDITIVQPTESTTTTTQATTTSTKGEERTGMVATDNDSITVNEMIGKSIESTPRRRDALKRQRALTATISMQHMSQFSAGATASSDQLLSIVPSLTGCNSNSSTSASGSKSARSIRRRALTLTCGITRLSEVHSFEDIVVTKEEFQTASIEFERLFASM